MRITGARIRVWVTLVLVGAALVANALAMILERRAAPYLGALDLLPLPVTGLAYGAAAGLFSLGFRLVRPWSLAAVSVGLAAPALSFGLAPESRAWVAVASLGAFVVPAVGWTCLATLRGGEPGAEERNLVLAAASVTSVSVVLRATTLDPSEFGWCECAENPLSVAGDPGTYVVLEPWLTAAHLTTVAVVLLAVALSALHRPGRRSAPEHLLVAGMATAAGGWVFADVASLRGAPTSATDTVVGAGLLAVLGAHLAVSARRRPSRAHVADLLLAARERSDPGRLQELVSRAVGDPSAAVYWWDPVTRTYVDHLGRAADAEVAGAPDSHVLVVDSNGAPIARVVTEHDLERDPDIVEPVAAALRLSRENERLQAELAHSLLEVRESRSRIVQASDDARRRIERDLHDGAQQLLISTGAKLNLATTRVDTARDAELAETLAAASDELGRALEELRALARGITPTPLVHGALPDALEDLALRCPVPTRLHVEGAGAVAPEVAATAYFVVAECLANVAKHAQAANAQVSLVLGDPLRVVVRDDGVGGADSTAGSGLHGLLDRVAAQGGSLDVDTSTSGTTVTARLPNGAT